ncbi:MAG: alpha/beta hydrolase [Desulfatitalea sp.]
MITVEPQVKTQSIGDTQITYLDYGGDGPPLVMLHATGFLPWLWHPIARQVAATYRVIAPALFAHRPADPYSGGLAWMQLAQDLKQLCAELAIENGVFVGHSMGAAVATLAHAVLGLAAAKLVLIEPIFLPAELYRLPLTVAQHPLAAKAVKRRNQWRDRQEARSDFKSKPFFQSWDEEVLALYIEHGLSGDNGDGVQLTCTPRQEAALFMGGSHFDPWPVLPSVVCPTLVVEGEGSENRPWIDLKRVTQLIPQGHYAAVAGAGHLVPMEKPIETAKLLQAFVCGTPMD